MSVLGTDQAVCLCLCLEHVRIIEELVYRIESETTPTRCIRRNGPVVPWVFFFDGLVVVGVGLTNGLHCVLRRLHKSMLVCVRRDDNGCEV